VFLVGGLRVNFRAQESVAPFVHGDRLESWVQESFGIKSMATLKELLAITSKSDANVRRTGILFVSIMITAMIFIAGISIAIF
jgi:hypothetical protein